jgi:16S rRNA (guanine966-N2)-methyltransferase
VLRVIGGRFGGRKLLYGGDPRTRPMKERIREAIFNLISTEPKGKHALDLFAGTGALGLEALSRGAEQATFIERHFPTAGIIRRNAAELDVTDRCHVVAADTFLWWRRIERRRAAGEETSDASDSHDFLPAGPLVVFCSPPYDFYVDRRDDMLRLIGQIHAEAAEGSVTIVESDARFDHQRLEPLGPLDTRRYPPAVVSVIRK